MFKQLFGSKTRNDHKNQDIRWTQQSLVVFACAESLFLILYSVYGASFIQDANTHAPSKFVGLLGTLGLLAFAAFCIGSVLGFLFGIPKSISEDKKPPASEIDPLLPPEQRRLYRSNTNLEEMSDWLTKIIVGAGLVGAKDLVDSIGRLIGMIAESLAGAPFVDVVAGSIMVASLVLGFFTIYLLTRLFLAGAFTRAETTLRQSAIKAQSLAEMNLSDLTPAEKNCLRQVILAHEQKNDYKLPADFATGGALHEALQSLRDRLILRPEEGEEWQAGNAVRLTPLAEQIIGKLREAAN
jgi:hypothetical protein